MNIVLAIIICITTASSAFAAPDSTDPSRIIDSLITVPTPNERLEAPEIIKPQKQIIPTKKIGDVPTFTLNKVNVTGSTVFTDEDFIKIYKNLINKTVSFDDIQAIADGITQMYHRRNFVLSKAVVPAQDIDNGNISIQVIEGVIKAIHIEGYLPEKAGKVLRYAAKIKSEIPFNYKRMEHYILLMNDLPGINVEATLKPSHTSRHKTSKSNKVISSIYKHLNKLDISNKVQQEFIQAVQQEIQDDRNKRIQELAKNLINMGFTEDQSKLLALKAFKEPNNKPKQIDYAALGGSDIILRVSHKMINSFITVDNLGTKFIGPVQYGAGVQINHSDENGELSSTSIRANVTPSTEEMRYLSITHEKVINDYGTKFSFNYQITKSEPGSNLKDLEFENISEAVSLKFTHPHIRSRSENLNSRISLDFRKSEIISLDTRLSQDRLTVLRAGATYDFADTYKGINLFDFEISKGLDIISATKDRQTKSRANGESQFTKLTAQASRLQKLSPRFNLLASARGQYSFNPLLSSEEFGFGGSQFGRGLDPSEITGDHGYSAKLELIYSVPLPENYIQEYQLYTFYDFGTTWNISDTPEKRKFGSTAGIGARFKLSETYSGFLELNKPISRNIASSGGDGGRDYNASFRIRADW